MSFIARLQRAREILEQQGRLSTRALVLEIGDEQLDELIEELVDVQQVARREGKILVWAGASATPPSDARAPSPTLRAADQAETRKVISIIFADLMGSTALQERLDPESVNRVMDAYYQAVRGPVEAAGGTVVQLLGDGVLCAFGIPQIAQDDALRAVRAAVGIQHAFREFLHAQQWLNVAIGLRVAVNTGEVVVSDEHPAGIGDPLNVAARLQQEARDGEVVIGQATRRLVANAVTLEQAGVFALKGRAETVTAYRVVSLERPTGATTAAFVGRDDELARITAVYDAARTTQAARLAVVVGSPGLGKSRLIEEIARRLGPSAEGFGPQAGDASVVTAQCDAAGGATFAPVAEALRTWLGAGRSDQTDPSAALEALIPESPERARIITGITALLAGSPASPEETFFVIRRFLTALAHTKPAVLVIDDLHWAEPLLLDLVEHLIQWGSGVPLFVLIGARPELRELRSSLVTPGGHVADVVTLAGLDAGAAMRLAANVIGAADLPAAVAAKVLATSEGNPLFVGELVRMLVDEGAIERQGERWIVGANLAALEMPPTIHALLAARIERLRPEERTVLERASVVGRHFSRGAVAALLSRNGSDLDARIEALQRGELIERDNGWFLGEPVLRFHHVLIRDAAYRRLLKGTRAELHTRLADWIETQVGDVAEHDETIGWHFEQAHQHLRELGPVDAKGRALGERAAQRLAAAGRRALARDDLPVAANLLGRAIDRLDIADRARADLALDWCEALLSAGDVGQAANALAELARFAGGCLPLKKGGQEGFVQSSGEQIPLDPPFSKGEADRLHAWHSCFASQLIVLTAPQGLQAAADAVAEAARQLAAQGDDAGEAKAHSVHAQALARLGKVGPAEAALDQALAAARKAGDRRRANAVLAGAPLAALWGPSPVTRASGRCLDVVRVLRITQGAPAVESVALSCQGVLEALRGRTEAARRMLASARKMVEDLGIANRLFEADAFAGRIAAMEGDSATAERLLRGAYDGLRDLGLGIDAARAGALLGRALLAQDRSAEAEALSHESEALAGDDLQAAIAWRGVRAEALAKRGEHAAAVELAKAAVGIASATDALLDHADARVALAVALRAAGRGAEADAEERRAIELWEAKGATLLAERARRDGGRAAPDSATVAEPTPAPRAVSRRVRPNAATSMQARFDAALAARDFDAIAAVFHEDHQEVDHPTGSSYGRGAAVASLQRLFRSRDPHYEVEPLATLGEFLVLVRRRSGAAGTATARYDVGAYENEAIQLFEVDASGLCRSAEVFAVDHLGDAIARLYERHADLLPVGPEREHAAATARMFDIMLTSGDDIDRVATVIAPDFESVDHRPLSTWSMRGGGAFLEHLRALREVAADVVIPARDILALGPNALLTQRLHSGTERVGGGAYERPFLVLFVTDADGLLVRAEWFDTDREAEALARFDEITGTHVPAPIRRRVRPNVATHGLERLESALRARDGRALKDVFHESLHVVHHSTRASYGRREMLGAWRSVIKAVRFEFRSEVLASLGGALALEHHLLALEGLSEDDVPDIGRAEFDEIALVEADDRGRWLHCEIFAADRLGDAVARLYDLYAALVPDGPQRERATATARSVAAFADSSIAVDLLAAAMTPDFEQIDHRIFATWSVSGAGPALEHYRALHAVADELALPIDDVLAARPDALLARRTHTGTDRQSGGRYERVLLFLFVAGADGQAARVEFFGADREAEALARFEEIAGSVEAETPPEPFANAASRTDSELFRCFNTRDWAGIEPLAAPELVFDERRRLVRNTCSREVWLEQLRVLFDVPASRFITKLLATRGERLSLSLHRFTGEVAGGGGPLALDGHLALHEVDRRGRIVAIMLFDRDDAAAYAELDARYYAGECAARPAQGAIMRAFTHAVVSRDWDPVLALCAPEFIEHDHRSLAVLGTTRGAAAWARNFSTLVDLAPDTVYRVHHFRSAARGFCSVGTWAGSRDGGGYEIPLIAVLELDDCDRLARADIYDVGQLDGALARFDEMASAATTAGHWENSASRAWREVIAAWRQRDLERFAALQPSPLRYRDHRRLFRLDLDREGFLEFTRPLLTMRSASAELELLATRGERLALMRFILEMEDEVVGPSAIDSLLLIQTDERGAITAYDRYEIDDQDAARAEIEARWEAGEGATHTHAPLAALAKSNLASVFTERAWAAFDVVDLDDAQQTLDAARAHFSPDFVWEDRRPIVGLSGGLDLMLASARERLASGARHQRRTIVATAGDRVAVGRILWAGGPPDGRFEVEFLAVHEVNEAGPCTALIFFDPDDERAAQREAWARWARIDPVAAPWVELLTEITDAWNSRDRPRLRARFADDVVIEDHRHAGLGRIEGAEAYVDSSVVLWELAPEQRLEIGWSWPAVDRHGFVVTLRREGTVPDGGPFESEYLMLGLARNGLVTRGEIFEIDALDTALARFEELRPDAPQRFANAATATVGPVMAHMIAHDWQRFEQLFAESFRMSDRRRVVQLDLDRDQYLAFTREIADGRAIRARSEIVATRGERLALTRSTFELTDGDVGPSEVAFLLLTQVDARGQIVAYVRWDLEDLGAARAELDARWAAHGAAQHPRASKWLAGYLHAFAVRDWTAMAALFTPDLVGENHRLVGWGTRHGPAGVVSTLQAQIDLAPDTLERVDHVRTCDGAVLFEYAWHGTREGGAFENVWLVLVELAGDGRAGRADVWEPEQLDVARARFAELVLSRHGGHG